MERHNSTVSLIALLVLDVFLTGVTGLAPSYLIIASVDPQLSFSEAYFQDALPRSVSDAQRLFEISKGEVKRLQERYGQQSDHVSDDNRRLLTAQIKLSGAKRNLLKRQQLDHASEIKAIYWYPAFFTSIWLWLYAVSGFLLKAARRFDLGFQWFNSKLDVEKKPLQAIGLVSGAIVAVVYWSFALVAHFL